MTQSRLTNPRLATLCCQMWNQAWQINLKRAQGARRPLTLRCLPLQSLTLMLLPSLLAANVASRVVAAETRVFGDPGQSGTPGQSGRDGQDIDKQVIWVTGQPQSVDLSGRDGEDGTDGRSGQDARNCRQPSPVSYNLRGAEGGNGGNGGNGGRGGHGGSATLFFENLADLRNLQLQNNGGQGGRGGRGGQAGFGCPIRQEYWKTYDCNWALMQRNRTVPDAAWQERKRQRFACTGDAAYDQHNRRPPVQESDRTYDYTWKFMDVGTPTQLRATPGKDGESGYDGATGQSGSFGQVLLVQGEQIPTEQLKYSGPLSSVVGQAPVQLLKNNWPNKTGLRRYLAPGSQVPDQYQQLETVRDRFQVLWQVEKSYAELGNPKITSTIDAAGQLKFELPGHLDYRRSRVDDVEQIAIVHGFEPERLRQFKFNGFNQFKDARRFSLMDQGQLLGELKQTRLVVAVTDGDSTVQKTYRAIGETFTDEGLEIVGDTYKLQLNQRFDELMTPGKKLKYQIQIRQVARSGEVYESKIEVEQVVDEVTFQG